MQAAVLGLQALLTVMHLCSSRVLGDASAFGEESGLTGTDEFFLFFFCAVPTDNF